MPGNNVCPKTFTMEEEWGRARVMKQRVDPDPRLQEAIDTCPVSCIHWSVTSEYALSSDQIVIARPFELQCLGSSSRHVSRDELFVVGVLKYAHMLHYLQGLGSPAELARGLHGKDGANCSLEHDGWIYGGKQGCIFGKPSCDAR